jgi:predicted DNA-binding protein (MmcQ/YjbR family)
MSNQMNIESVRDFALSLNEQVTEELFAKEWISWRICGKWFLLMQLDAPEPRVAVKLPPEVGEELRERYGGIRPAYHMNKIHWNDLYLNKLDEDFVKELITKSYQLVISRLPKKYGLTSR